jgi:hypothetical protein
MKTKVLFKPENELLAMSIKSLLENEGIYSILHSYQIPAYDGIAQMMRPQWGEILVAEEDYAEAKEILDIFLASATESSKTNNDNSSQADNNMGQNKIKDQENKSR